MNSLLSYALYSGMHKSFLGVYTNFIWNARWWNFVTKKQNGNTQSFGIPFQFSKCTSNQFNIPKSTTKFQFWDAVWIWPLLPVHCYVKTGATNEGPFACREYATQILRMLSFMFAYSCECRWMPLLLYFIVHMRITFAAICGCKNGWHAWNFMWKYEKSKKMHLQINNSSIKESVIDKTHLLLTMFRSSKMLYPNFFSCSSSFSQQLH